MLTEIYENYQDYNDLTTQDDDEPTTPGSENKEEGRIVFHYNITLKANHESTMWLYSGSLLPKTENAITNFIEHHCGGQQQEGEFEAILTPRGSEFKSPEEHSSYNTFVNHYCDIVSSLKEAINSLNLCPYIKLKANSNSRAINALGEEVPGPTKRAITIPKLCS